MAATTPSAESPALTIDAAPGTRHGKDSEKKGISLLDQCTVLAMFLLAGVAFIGPIYAFVLMSCISEQPCRGILPVLQTARVTCAESDYTIMLHGERCTVICDEEGLKPTVPELTCADGEIVGAETLQCKVPRVYTAPSDAGLVSGAIVDGELRTACFRARNLRCGDSPGTAILLRWQNVTIDVCDDIMAECSALNSAFAFMQHQRYAPDDERGVCDLGCYVPAVPPEYEGPATAQMPTAPPPAPAFEPPPTGLSRDRCDEPDGYPACVNVNTSCNEADNGDYYRYPTCATNRPQWVKLDQTRRIRYDSQPQFSQGGKWLLEADADPATDRFGEEFARQPSFELYPLFEANQWNFKCLYMQGPIRARTWYEQIWVELAECTCDSWNDCSGNGLAVGSKTTGPNCHCDCFPAYRGVHCERKLCKVPPILHSFDPPCLEGLYLEPESKCTPRCEEGYAPTYSEFTCLADGSGLDKSPFECRRSRSAPNSDAQSLSEEFGLDISTQQIPECTPLDCNWRGVPTGDRHPDGSCVCECGANYTGPDCMVDVSNRCRGPMQHEIIDSATSPCVEGYTITTVCTATCKEGGYFPIPSTLTCTKYGLEPPTFECYGGPDMRALWCETMGNIAIGTSVVSVLGILFMCFWKGTSYRQTFQDYITKGSGMGVVIEEDREIARALGLEEGPKYHVVQAFGREPGGHLPERLAKRHERIRKERARDEFALENGTLTSNSLLYVPNTLEVLGSGTDPLVTINALEKLSGEADFRTSAEVNDEMDLVREQLIELHRTQFGPTPEPSDAGDLPGAGDTLRQLATALEDVPAEEESSGAALAPWMQQREKPKKVDPRSPELHYNQELPPPVGSQTLQGENAGKVSTILVPFVYPEDDSPPQHVPQKQPFSGTGFLLNQQPEDMEWSERKWDLETKAGEARRIYGRKLQEDANRAGAAAAADIFDRLEETAQERADVEVAIQDAMRAGDGPALRVASNRAHAVLKKITDAPASSTANLVRLLQIADSRLEQYDEREVSRASKAQHQDRVQRGLAPDWTITPEQFWRYAEAGNVEKVRAGLKARLPVMPKSKDGQRLTVLHVACRPACGECATEGTTSPFECGDAAVAAEGGSDAAAAVRGGDEATAAAGATSSGALGLSEISTRRLDVIRALLDARAHANAIDVRDRTPLDLAVCEGGLGAEGLPIVTEMRRLGLVTQREEMEAARAASDAAAAAASSPGSPGAGSTPQRSVAASPPSTRSRPRKGRLVV